MGSSPSLAFQLAEFTAGITPAAVSTTAMERAKMSLASTTASAAMGYTIESARIIRRLELENAGSKVATVWFDGTKLPLAAAARVNAVASDAAASDDSDLRSIAHIGTIVSVTSLAVGERVGATGSDILRAMVLGYEVAGRIDEALTPGRMKNGFHGSVSTVFGAVITASRLMNLPVPQMAQAIALAATSIGGMAIAADSSCAREYHAGMAAATGIQAVLAARRGFTAELAVLEHPRGFLAAMGGQSLDDITRDFGKDWDIVTDMAIKLMPGAHPFHATAEAAADAARLGNVVAEDIDSIVISAAVQWTNFKGHPHPNNLVDAAHSLHYFVAAAIADRGFDWQHMDSAKMADPVIGALQDKVSFDPSPSPLPDRFPHRHGGTVTIRMKNGRVFSSTCKAPRGSGPRGVEWGDVEKKYRDLVPLAGMTEERVEASLSLIRRFHELDGVSEFVAILAEAGSPEVKV
jgi:2-methylcitrate dehydratase PrpD